MGRMTAGHANWSGLGQARWVYERRGFGVILRTYLEKLANGKQVRA